MKLAPGGKSGQAGRPTWSLRWARAALDVCLHLGVIGARMTSQDRLGDELAGRKILPYGDAARAPVAQGEARREHDAGLDPLTQRLGQPGPLITEGPLPGRVRRRPR